MSLLIIRNGMTPLLLLAEIRTFATISPSSKEYLNLPHLCLLLNQFLSIFIKMPEYPLAPSGPGSAPEMIQRNTNQPLGGNPG
jgi:hypothetical protein